MNDRFDWTHIQSFLAVMEEGSFSAAALRLRRSQPTLGRDISSLEAALGQTLFLRGRSGAQPLDAATALMPAAQAMAQAAVNLRMVSDGEAHHITGSVRISASEVVATYVLPQILGEILNDHSGLEVDIVASNSNANLLLREADIAIRMTPPTQLDVVSRKIGMIETGLFAHESYLAKHPEIHGFADIKQHIVLGYDQSDLMLQALIELGVPAERSMFRLRSDAQALHVEYLRQGVGIVATQSNLARSMENVVQILPDLPVPSLPMYLITHRQLRNSAPVRAVFDALAAGLKPWTLG